MMHNEPPDQPVLPNQSHPRVFTDNKSLRRHLLELRPGDKFIGRLRVKQSEEYLLTYLLEKGVILYPSALAQLLARSKVIQAELLHGFMVPHTHVVHDIHDLMLVMSLFGQLEDGRVITKLDRANAGLGIHLWSSVEDVYNQASLKNLPFPFVIQPFCPDCRDIRVIILADYQEAYYRDNPGNFRNNLHCGGVSSKCELSAAQERLCRRVMELGKFPYGHIDLMVSKDGRCFLGEINLRGGIRGAEITPAQYKERLEAIHLLALEG